jgi:hypothetical protein
MSFLQILHLNVGVVSSELIFGSAASREHSRNKKETKKKEKKHPFFLFFASGHSPDRFTCEISIQTQTPCDQNSRGCSPKTTTKTAFL